MHARVSFTILLVATAIFLPFANTVAPACCPAPRSGEAVVNADQTVIILWDAATKTQHFIRKASFKSAGDDFGFLIPSPAQPELNESGNDAFVYLQKLTEPVVQTVRRSRGLNCGCEASAPRTANALPEVRVLEEKLVAGFNAVVLEAKSATDLVSWLKEHDYAFSPEIEAWAKPYVDQGWKITALKVAKDKGAADQPNVTASALRMTFKTDRPLFPYREPDTKQSAQALGAQRRLLRVYFIGEARYQGDLTKENPWTGQVAWANKLSAENRKQTLGLLKLPETTGPAEWWMTEFEDAWPYQVAPADLYFARSANQGSVARPPIIEYTSASWPTDASVYALAVVCFAGPFIRWRRRHAA